MNTTFLSTTLLALSLIPLAARDDRPGPPPPGPVIQVLDADGDHHLSADEIANASEALRSLDSDGDNRLSHEEIRPPRPPRDNEEGERPEGEGRRPLPPVIAALDSDRDGTLSEDEIDAAADSLSQLDRNGDEIITPEEMRPERPPRRNQGDDSDDELSDEQRRGPRPGHGPPRGPRGPRH